MKKKVNRPSRETYAFRRQMAVLSIVRDTIEEATARGMAGRCDLMFWAHSRTGQDIIRMCGIKDCEAVTEILIDLTDECRASGQTPTRRQILERFRDFVPSQSKNPGLFSRYYRSVSGESSALSRKTAGHDMQRAH